MGEGVEPGLASVYQSTDRLGHREFSGLRLSHLAVLEQRVRAKTPGRQRDLKSLSVCVSESAAVPIGNPTAMMSPPRNKAEL